MAPQLSIVIPVRNGMPYIRDALESVLVSDISDVEVIVMENFSTDGTSEWLASVHDPRVRVVTAAEPRSAGENWTAACEHATGTWTKLLCADDFVLAGGLERQLAAALSEPEVALVASRRRVVSDSGRTVIARHGLSGFVGRMSGAQARTRAIRCGANPFGEPSSGLMRTDALLASLPFTAKYPYLTDLDMYARVLEHGSFIGLATVDAAFRLSATSWSASIGNSQLREHREWIDSLKRAGSYRSSPWQTFVTSTSLRLRFIARRIITTLTPR